MPKATLVNGAVGGADVDPSCCKHWFFILFCVSPSKVEAFFQFGTRRATLCNSPHSPNLVEITISEPAPVAHLAGEAAGTGMLMKVLRDTHTRICELRKG